MRLTPMLLAGSLVLGCRARAARTLPPDSTALSPRPSDTTRGSAAPPLPPGERPPGRLAAFPLNRDTSRTRRVLTQGDARIPACGSGAPRISGDSVGPFRLDETIAELKRAC